MTDRYLTLEKLTRRFPGRDRPAVENVSLEVAKGEILALLGPSGSGKTTTLRLLAGFESPDEGRVLVEGEDVTRLPPARRRFGMVFQHYALFPHLDVGENVGFGLESKGAAARDQVARALQMVDLAGFERRSVTELSGGQQQRVALARSLAPSPRVLLLDEPLSNLDPALRERTRKELREAIKRIGITTVFVTHEQEEAFDLGDRVAVLAAGRLEQIGTPDDLYDHPATEFVARFIGRVNELPQGLVRPESLALTPAGQGSLQGTVTSRRFAGGYAYFTVETSAGHLEIFAPHDAAKVGEKVGVEVGAPVWRSRRGGGV